MRTATRYSQELACEAALAATAPSAPTTRPPGGESIPRRSDRHTCRGRPLSVLQEPHAWTPCPVGRTLTPRRVRRRGPSPGAVKSRQEGASLSSTLSRCCQVSRCPRARPVPCTDLQLFRGAASRSFDSSASRVTLPPSPVFSFLVLARIIQSRRPRKYIAAWAPRATPGLECSSSPAFLFRFFRPRTVLCDPRTQVAPSYIELGPRPPRTRAAPGWVSNLLCPGPTDYFELPADRTSRALAIHIV